MKRSASNGSHSNGSIIEITMLIVAMAGLLTIVAIAVAIAFSGGAHDFGATTPGGGTSTGTPISTTDNARAS